MLKISDFGLSALYGSDHDSTLLHTTCGTPNYVAPEVLADKGYDGFTADIWSCGVILYVLLAGFLPFDEPSMSALFRKIIKAEFSYPSWFTQSVKDLLNQILVSPEKRLSITQIKASDWFMEGGYIEDDDSQLLVAEADDFEAAEELEMGHEVNGLPLNPQSMNAFELITMCGGLDLTPILDKTSTGVHKLTRFHSQQAPLAIIQKIVGLLVAQEIEHKVLERNFKIKIISTSERGQLTCTVQVFTIAPGSYLVDWRRGMGDSMSFYKFYQGMRAQLADLVSGDDS